ncbi:MAG: aminotransferase class I/II-fold pyridoxal phosphate-dependent enzyme [Chloroflexus sp.]
MTTPLSAERVRQFGTTIFAEISALAAQCGAVNLGQGFPDFSGPEWVKQAAAAAIAADANQYAPYIGVPRLREAIAATWQAQGWRTIDPQREVTVTSGATEALFAATQALVDPGDEVILFEPFYDAYLPDVTMAGGVPRFVRLHPPTAHQPGWWFDPMELQTTFSPRTRLLILNTPHNPTGKVFRRSELEQIAELCQTYNVIVIADEVYDQLVFAGAEHIPIATLPGMWERTLTINSIGKTFSLTGWKIGYAVGPAHLNDALRAAHQWITFATATPLQFAAAAALEGALQNGYYQQFRAEYTARYHLLAEILSGVGLPVLPTEGSYFLMADITATGFRDDVSFCRYLTQQVGVAAIPPSAFYARRHDLPLLARFCFAKRDETLRAAQQRLQAWRQRA